jgi:hypothetical protein
VWSRRSLEYYADQKAGGRKLQSSKSQDVHQLAGDIVLAADGRVALAYYSKETVDRPSVPMLVDACRTDLPPVSSAIFPSTLVRTAPSDPRPQ